MEANRVRLMSFSTVGMHNVRVSSNNCFLFAFVHMSYRQELFEFDINSAISYRGHRPARGHRVCVRDLWMCGAVEGGRAITVLLYGLDTIN